MSKHWHVNHNTPGYLPEADGVTVREWDDAWEALREEIANQQEYFGDMCWDGHETLAEYGNCMSGGEFRCEWAELWAHAEADRQTVATPHNFTVTYATPAGPDVAVFVAECHESDCEMTWE